MPTGMLLRGQGTAGDPGPSVQMQKPGKQDVHRHLLTLSCRKVPLGATGEGRRGGCIAKSGVTVCSTSVQNEGRGQRVLSSKSLSARSGKARAAMKLFQFSLFELLVTYSLKSRCWGLKYNQGFLLFGRGSRGPGFVQ